MDEQSLKTSFPGVQRNLMQLEMHLHTSFKGKNFHLYVQALNSAAMTHMKQRTRILLALLMAAQPVYQQSRTGFPKDAISRVFYYHARNLDLIHFHFLSHWAWKAGTNLSSYLILLKESWEGEREKRYSLFWASWQRLSHIKIIFKSFSHKLSWPTTLQLGDN